MWDGADSGCTGPVNCTTQCISGDLYCSIDPDGDLFKGISGANVVEENLRQLCVYKVAKAAAPDDFAWLWWQRAWNRAILQLRARRPAAFGVSRGIRARLSSGCSCPPRPARSPAPLRHRRRLLRGQLQLRHHVEPGVF